MALTRAADANGVPIPLNRASTPDGRFGFGGYPRFTAFHREPGEHGHHTEQYSTSATTPEASEERQLVSSFFHF